MSDSLHPEVPAVDESVVSAMKALSEKAEAGNA